MFFLKEIINPGLLNITARHLKDRFFSVGDLKFRLQYVCKRGELLLHTVYELRKM